MNVYKIESHYIAAEKLEHAWYEYLEETSNIENIFDDITLGEGGSHEVTISARRLTEKEIDKMTVPCCQDGCEECEELDEPVQHTYRELLERTEDVTPRVLAFEE